MAGIFLTFNSRAFEMGMQYNVQRKKVHQSPKKYIYTVSYSCAVKTMNIKECGN